MNWKTKLFSPVLYLCVMSLAAMACGEKSPPDTKKEATAVEGATSADAVAKIAAAEPNHDFGTVKQGATVDHVFKIRNEGKANLEITSAKGS